MLSNNLADKIFSVSPKKSGVRRKHSHHKDETATFEKMSPNQVSSENPDSLINWNMVSRFLAKSEGQFWEDVVNSLLTRLGKNDPRRQALIDGLALRVDLNTDFVDGVVIFLDNTIDPHRSMMDYYVHPETKSLHKVKGMLVMKPDTDEYISWFENGTIDGVHEEIIPINNNTSIVRKNGIWYSVKKSIRYQYRSSAFSVRSVGSSFDEREFYYYDYRQLSKSALKKYGIANILT